MNSWPLFHFDVKTAFFSGDIHEMVFVKQPHRLIAPDKEHMVYRLHKALYGLRQSSRAWHQRIDTYLISIGLQPCSADPSLYVCHDGDSIVLLIIYVDDLLLTGNQPYRITAIQDQLCQEFAMTVLGSLSLYLDVDCL